MKKATSVIIIISMLMALLFSTNVAADGNTTTVGYLTFTEYDTYCAVTGCNNSATGEIIIPSSVDFDGQSLPVTSIGANAFSECGGLTSVTIPDGVTSIGADAFAGCWNLTSVTIPDGVTSIGADAFNGCSGLTSVTIPDGVTSIGADAFNSCSGLTSVTIPDGVTSIGTYAFSGCSSLTTVTLPESLTYIGEAAFSYELGSVVIDTVYYGGSEEQWYNINIEPDNDAFTYATIIYNDPGQQGSDEYDGPLTFTDCGDHYEVSGCDTSASGEIDIPSSVTISGNTLDVTSIGEGALSGCWNLTSVTIPDGVTSIGAYAFSGCYNLTSVTIPDGIELIDEGMFNMCYSLANLIIPDGVTSIGAYAFSGCSSLTSVTVPDGVTSIGEYAFSGCSSLTTVTLPESLTFIGEEAFSSELGSVVIDTVYYGGSEEQWYNINIEPDNDAFTYATVIYNDPGQQSDEYDGPLTFAECEDYYEVSGCDQSVSGDIDIPSSVTISGNTLPVTAIGASAFSGCGDLTSVTIPDSVTSIGEYAFSECYNLTSVTIPDSVTSIGAYAFGWCWNLTNVIIPGGVTLIDEGAFCWCSSLTVTIPNSVVSIGNSAFEGCGGLTSVTIPAGITFIGDHAFSECYSLNTVYYGGSEEQWNEINIIESGNDALINATIIYSDPGQQGSDEYDGPLTFTDCGDHYEVSGCDTSASGEIDIPSSVTISGNTLDVTSIGANAFSECGGLASVTIPDGVTSIGAYAFCGCSSLTSVTIPDGVTSIGADAFAGCYNLTSVTIPDGIELIDEGMFYMCCSLANLIIPDGVTSIGAYAFCGCSSLTSVTIPNSVVSIGSSAFEDCGGLTSVTIPEGVTTISDHMFNGCTSLTSVTLPESLTYIGGAAFASELGSVVIDTVYYGGSEEQWYNINIEPDNDALFNATIIYNDPGQQGSDEYDGPLTFTDCGDHYEVSGCDTSASGEIDIPSSVTISGKTLPVTSIGAYAFNRCGSLTSVTIPDGVTAIGNGAFSNCTKLKSITFGDSVTSIGASAFYGCNSLTSVTIPGSVEVIGEYAFQSCTGLTSVTITEGVTTISDHMFNNCTSLTSVTLPESVTKIEGAAFAWCTGITEIKLSSNITELGDYALSGCTALTAIELPEKLKVLGRGVFSSCYGLTEIVIPEGVTVIPPCTFEECRNLVSVTIPKSVRIIEKGNTFNALSLKTVYYNGTAEEWKNIDIQDNTFLSLKIVLNGGVPYVEETYFWIDRIQINNNELMGSPDVRDNGSTEFSIDEGDKLYILGWAFGHSSNLKEIVYSLNGGEYIHCGDNYRDRPDIIQAFRIDELYGIHAGFGYNKAEEGGMFELTGINNLTVGTYTLSFKAIFNDGTSSDYMEEYTLNVNANEKLNIIVEEVEAKANETVNVKIGLINNPGVSSIKLSVSWNSQLKLSGVQFDINKTVSEETMTNLKELNFDTITNSCTLNWLVIDGKADDPELTFVTLTFTVDKNVLPDHFLEIRISAEENNIFDSNEQNIEFKLKSGGINVISGVANQKGDVNYDGAVDNKDIVTLFRYISQSRTDADLFVFDFNEDGNVDNKDVVSLFRFVSAMASN